MSGNKVGQNIVFCTAADPEKGTEERVQKSTECRSEM